MRRAKAKWPRPQGPVVRLRLRPPGLGSLRVRVRVHIVYHYDYDYGLCQLSRTLLTFLLQLTQSICRDMTLCCMPRRANASIITHYGTGTLVFYYLFWCVHVQNRVLFSPVVDQGARQRLMYINLISYLFKKETLLHLHQTDQCILGVRVKTKTFSCTPPPNAPKQPSTTPKLWSITSG